MQSAQKMYPLPEPCPDQPALKRIGNTVRKRIANDPSVYRFQTTKAEIYAVGDFIAPRECDNLIRRIDAVAQPSVTYGHNYSGTYRTSYSGNFDKDDPVVKTVERRIDDLLGLPYEIGERVQGQRYLPGQQFKPHFDWFHPTDETCWPIERGRGGQRSWTAMAFLNDVEEGGDTEFTHARMAVTPKRGALLFWNNADMNGYPNEDTMHAGTPVIAGVKYVITKWYRVRRWG